MDRLLVLLTSVVLGTGVMAEAPVAQAKRMFIPTQAPERALTLSATIEGGVQLKLPAKLTLPEGAGPFPAVVLVHGSGPGDMDQTLGEYRPFRELAQGLSRRGVAVLRYDKRTQVNPAGPVHTVADEIIEDARAAVRLLAAQREVDARQVFLLGYDLGAHVAPRIVAGEPVAGAILMAGAARPLWELHVDQVRHALSTDGTLSADDKRQIKEEEAAVKRIKSAQLRPGDTVNLLGHPTPASYWLDLRSYDAVKQAAGLRVPLLLLFGDADQIVTAQDRELWQKGLSGHAATFKIYPGLNHLLRPASGQGELADIERSGPISADLVTDVAAWIHQQGSQHSPAGRR